VRFDETWRTLGGAEFGAREAAEREGEVRGRVGRVSGDGLYDTIQHTHFTNKAVSRKNRRSDERAFIKVAVPGRNWKRSRRKA